MRKTEMRMGGGAARSGRPPGALRRAAAAGAPGVRALAVASAFLASAVAPAAAQDGTVPTPPTEALEALAPRSIGPAVTGGRIHDVEALPGDPSTLWVATASGGLWKSDNRGHTWREVFGDDHGTASFGDLALAPSDPRILYAGTGEQQNRQSSTWGNGVYRSDDGGETWRHLGLEETRHVGRVLVHPGDPDVAWVAAVGNLWRGGGERGVYRTLDGGRTWERVLPGENEWTGAIDLAMDPADPDLLYAATYQRLRKAWGFNGGGPGSGIWRSTDGGDSWEELRNGIPRGDKGRIGLATAASRPGVVMATIEHAEESGTYRSEDGGDTWTRVSTLNPRPMYYSHISVDPTDDRVVYLLSTSAYRSRDGGRSWEDVSARPVYDVGVHADHHTIWIDPSDPEHYFLAGDAGLHETYDGGANYRKLNNLPIGQFYAIGVDLEEPYRIYGGMQDNHSWMGPSETRRWTGIVNDDWIQTGFGDGTFQQVDLAGPSTVYVGSQNGGTSRVDARTGASLSITPREPEGEEHRFDWTAPILASRHVQGRVYLGGNRLFVSEDRGGSWRRTADLTRGLDRDTLEIMGVRGSEIELSPHDGTSSHSEITAIAESPVDPEVLWIGTDDGLVRVSTDRGRTWADVSEALPGPERAVVSEVLASAAGREVAWVALDHHRDGDFAPYLYRSADLGRTWEPVHPALPPDAASVLSLAEHPDDPDVVFLGTEHRLHVTLDGGASWSVLPGFPLTSYDDLVVHPRERDLVAGTHGRSIWILDDTRPLAGLDGSEGRPVHVFDAGPGTLFHYRKATSYRAQAEYAGENPRDGIPVTYRIGGGADGDGATLVVEDAEGREVRRMAVAGGPGIHRVHWDLRRPLPERDDAPDPDEERLPRPVERRGPFVSPGTYRLRVETAGGSDAVAVEVRPDPLMPELTLDDYRAREAFLVRLLELEEEAEELRAELRASETWGTAEERSGAARDLDRIAGRARGLYSALEGGGVRPGSLEPPGAEHREALEVLAGSLERVRDALPPREDDR